MTTARTSRSDRNAIPAPRDRWPDASTSSVAGGRTRNLVRLSVDQREFVRPVTSRSARSTERERTPDPIVPTNPLHFGQVEAGVTASRSETVSNSGGDYVGVSSVSATGGFTIGFDGCTYASLAPFGCPSGRRCRPGRRSLRRDADDRHDRRRHLCPALGRRGRAAGREQDTTTSPSTVDSRSAHGVLSNAAAGTTVFDAVDNRANASPRARARTARSPTRRTTASRARTRSATASSMIGAEQTHHCEPGRGGPTFYVTRPG